jgi:hypothetical protein
MCRATTDAGGPRRCSGDTRAAYGAASAAVAVLERSQALLMSRLPAQAGEGTPGGELVQFADKDTRTEDIRREIDAAVAGLNTGQRWQQWLEVSQRFHEYSLNNQLLILLQRPTATRVAGFHKWQELGRSVNKGERAIWISAPMVKRVQDLDAAGNPKTGPDGRPVWKDVMLGFKTVPVYDVSSTSGEPLPQMPVVAFDRSSGQAPDGMHEDLATQVDRHGYTLEYRDLGAGDGIPDGYTDPRSKKVVINTAHSDCSQAVTLAHEIAHIELGHMQRGGEYHTRAGGQRGTMEVEAESVSYVIARRYGIKPDSAFAYIDGWAMGDTEKVRKTADTVSKAADRILKNIPRFSSTQKGKRND